MKDSAVRERILDVSSRLFYEQGYNLTGINQVIEEAEIARGSLYNHFKSKDELLMCYLETVGQTWLTNLGTYLKPIDNPRKKIIALFDHRISLQRDSRFSGCRFIKISAEVNRDQHSVFAFVAAHKKKYKAIIYQLVNEIKVPKHFTAETLTETIFLMLEGASAIGATQKDPEHLQEAKKIIKELI